MISPPPFFVPLSLSLFDMFSSNMFMAWLIQVFGLLVASYLPDMSGHILPEMFPFGAVPAYLVKPAKYIATLIFVRR